MTYLIAFCRYGHVLLDGPINFDIVAEYQKWWASIIEKCGPEPNIACYGSHVEWLKKHVKVLEEYQQLYNYNGNLCHLFIEHLIQRCGFQRREYSEVRLW